MVRAPCCEKMGLKKGPWTPEEDNILIAHIQRFGHGNWRALPRQAGLLRCGKSCRLRWINYLRPDIKRGNFTREEEDTIIQLHELLGNRWSAIAARLPGRTDNEIKNVWHTHIKKRLVSKNHVKTENVDMYHHQHQVMTSNTKSSEPASPEQSNSSSSSWTDTSNIVSGKEDSSFSSEADEFQMDDSFWSETLSLQSPIAPLKAEDSSAAAAGGGDGVEFWLKLLMEAGGEMTDLPEI